MKKTLFILGAGSSIDYGLPDGSKLYDYICEGIGDGKSSGGKLGSWRLNSLFPEKEESELIRFQEGISGAGSPSIDRFLRARRDDPSFQEIGRRAIASILLPLEWEAIQNSGIPIENCWISNLFNRLKVDDSFENLRKVDFVTFNYDRILAGLFSHKILHLTGCPQEDLPYYLKQFSVIHIHGSLDSSLSNGSNPYNGKYFPECISRSERNLRLFHEDPYEKNRCMSDRIYNLVKNCDKMVFLGFGYHEENLRKIFNGFEDIKSLLKKKEFSGGIAYSEGGGDRDEIIGRLGGDFILAEKGMGCSEFLDEYTVL